MLFGLLIQKSQLKQRYDESPRIEGVVYRHLAIGIGKQGIGDLPKKDVGEEYFMIYLMIQIFCTRAKTSIYCDFTEIFYTSDGITRSDSHLPVSVGGQAI